MGFVMAIAPLVIVGGIALLVIKSLEHKHKQGKLGK